MWYFENLARAGKTLFERPKEFLLPILLGLCIGSCGKLSSIIPRIFAAPFERVLQENIATFSCAFFCVICLTSINLFWLASACQGQVRKDMIIQRDLVPDYIKNIISLYFGYSSVNIGICLPILFFSIFTREAVSYSMVLVVLILTWLLIIMSYSSGYTLVPQSSSNKFHATGLVRPIRFYSLNFFVANSISLVSLLIFLIFLTAYANMTDNCPSF